MIYLVSIQTQTLLSNKLHYKPMNPFKGNLEWWQFWFKYICRLNIYFLHFLLRKSNTCLRQTKIMFEVLNGTQLTSRFKKKKSLEACKCRNCKAALLAWRVKQVVQLGQQLRLNERDSGREQ